MRRETTSEGSPNERLEFLRKIDPETQNKFNWRYLWTKNPWEFIRTVLIFLRERPLLLITFAYFLLHPSIASVLAVVIAFLCSQFINELFGQISVIANQHKLVTGAILPISNEAKDLQVQAYPVSAYLTPFNYNDMSFFLVESWQKFIPVKRMQNQPRTLDDTLAVYVFDTDEMLLTNVASYPAPLRQSFIVFDHAPNECGYFQRFLLLHETAHVLAGLAKIPFFSKFGFWVFVATALLAHVLFAFDLYAYLLFGLAILVGIRERLRDQAIADVKDEIVCDTIALMYLDQPDRDKLANMSALTKLLHDDSLSSRHNELRLDYLYTQARVAQEGKDPLDWLQENATWLFVRSNAISLLASIIATLAVAYYIEARPYFVWRFLFLLATLLVLFKYSHQVSGKNHYRITNFLSNLSKGEKQ